MPPEKNARHTSQNVALVSKNISKYLSHLKVATKTLNIASYMDFIGSLYLTPRQTWPIIHHVFQVITLTYYGMPRCEPLTHSYTHSKALNQSYFMFASSSLPLPAQQISSLWAQHQTKWRLSLHTALEKKREMLHSSGSWETLKCSWLI